MVREIIENLNEEADYSFWKVNKGTLEDDVDNMEKSLKDIAGVTNGGLVPEKIRTSKEYIKADQMFRRAFKKLQDFNKKSPKAFQRKLSKETRFKGIK